MVILGMTTPRGDEGKHIIVTILNNSPIGFGLANGPAALDSGKWVISPEGLLPPNFDGVAFEAQGNASDLATGTAGSMRYVNIEQGAEFHVTWRIPPWGVVPRPDNDFFVECKTACDRFSLKINPEDPGSTGATGSLNAEDKKADMITPTIVIGTKG